MEGISWTLHGAEAISQSIPKLGNGCVVTTFFPLFFNLLDVPARPDSTILKGRGGNFHPYRCHGKVMWLSVTEQYDLGFSPQQYVADFRTAPEAPARLHIHTLKSSRSTRWSEMVVQLIRTNGLFARTLLW